MVAQEALHMYYFKFCLVKSAPNIQVYDPMLSFDGKILIWKAIWHK